MFSCSIFLPKEIGTWYGNVFDGVSSFLERKFGLEIIDTLSLQGTVIVVDPEIRLESFTSRLSLVQVLGVSFKSGVS